MMRQDGNTVMLNELRDTIADVLDVDKELLNDDTHFINDLGIDSLLSLEVLVALERKFKVRLSEEDLQDMHSLRNIQGVLGKVSGGAVRLYNVGEGN